MSIVFFNNIGTVFLVLYFVLGVVYCITHFRRVRKHDRIRETPVGNFRWYEWPLLFTITVVLWPVAVYFYYFDPQSGRNETQ